MSAASASTATGTIATAEIGGPGIYRGRFAPSPTGNLHLGSLAAALASWLDARRHDGIWLVRIEDLDSLREQTGVAQRILATLAGFGLNTDEPVVWQSQREARYRSALARLRQLDAVYRCRCSRRERGENGACVADCRKHPPAESQPAAWRLHLAPTLPAGFDDAFQGRCEPGPADRIDPIVQRRDGIASYLLAVVVDDAAQGITDVVRGADLLGQTHAQIALALRLELPVPRHAHLPLLVEPDGRKLAKSRRSLPIDPSHAGDTLWRTLALLRQQPPTFLRTAPVPELLAWAVDAWNPLAFSGIRELAVE